MASLDPWFLADPPRFRREREALVALAARADWLTLECCRFEGACIVVDFDVDIGHRLYEAVLRFPPTYPHSPAVVRPRDGQARWSAHQFGDGGDLCLEYRPDNWSPDLMGWQLVESAFRLLSGENPAPEERAYVPSAHRMTEGQRLRNATHRLTLTRAIESRFNEIGPGQGVCASTVLWFTSDTLIRVITGLEFPNEPVWCDPEVPAVLKIETFEGRGYVRRLAAGERPPRTNSYEDFETDATQLGWVAGIDLFVVIAADGICAYSTHNGNARAITVIRAREARSRLSQESSVLAGKRVGIVGCGSLGSKVATMLARTGVGAFDLVDDDIVEYDNLVRHDLDWREVGQHKVAALANRLRRVQAQVEVRTQTQQLGGQEASTSAAGVLARLAECDLIIDATANPVVGNILSGFVQTTSIPMVWAEVFAGGIGGLIARHRPSTEPPLPMMRRAIENWFAERSVSASLPAEPYEATVGGLPMVANDADVTAIAAHAARVAIDLLIRPQASHFPWSVYVVALAPCDLFTQPFEVHPIKMPDPPPIEPTGGLTATETAEEFALLGRLFAGPARLS